MPTTQVRTFSLALKPSGLKKIKSDESHMLIYRIGIQCKFPAKCLLPKANSRKFLYNSTSHSVCNCSLILCASKTEFWQKKKKKVFVPCFKVMHLSPLISWQFPEESSGFWPVTLLFYCGNSRQVHSFNLYSQGVECKHLKKKQKNSFPFSFHLLVIYIPT